jgi:glutamate N-acetyltransferase/amino-acid N-acetyltransferase
MSAGKPGLAVSPLARPFPSIAPMGGVGFAVGRAGLYAHVRDDLLVIRLDEGATAAGVFTRHKVGSAPVDWCREALAGSGGRVRAVLVNAGCANSFTGEKGRRAVAACVEALSSELGCADNEILTASTGVIGAPLPYGKILNALPDMLARVRADGFEAAAGAIMTTDTFPKGAEAHAVVGGRTVRVAGFCKGSGMIAPNMATMLAFVITDAAADPQVLKVILAEEVEASLNAVTVDGDRSTNDTCLLIATGASKAPPLLAPLGPDADAFRGALRTVLLSLGQLLVRDGEGASKFVEVRVGGAASDVSARRIARTICESPLVKTAIAGEDANWGRIVMAVGRADEPLERDRLSVRFGDLWAAKDGARAEDYSEAAMSAYMKRQELVIEVDVGVGSGSATMWTCDLTHGYISINGDYRS